jgi:hypothetical protein
MQTTSVVVRFSIIKEDAFEKVHLLMKWEVFLFFFYIAVECGCVDYD